MTHSLPTSLARRALVAVAAFAAFTGGAYATPMLRISDGSSTITVADGGGTDANSASGVVTFIGSIGTWTLNVTTGVSFSPNGKLDLNSIDGSSAAGGTLTILLTDTGFADEGNVLSSIGGTTAGTVSYSTYWDANNTPFATTTLLDSSAFGTRSFSGSSMNGAPINDSSYSMTEVLTITHTRAGISSFDALMKVPDGGTTLLLLGIGLAAVGFSARRLAPISRR